MAGSVRPNAGTGRGPSDREAAPGAASAESGAQAWHTTRSRPDSLACPTAQASVCQSNGELLTPTTMRCPYIFNLRTDPYEHAQITSNIYYDWMFRRIYLLVPAQAAVGEFLSTFKEFPPRQKAASFSLDEVIDKMTEASKGA